MPPRKKKSVDLEPVYAESDVKSVMFGWCSTGHHLQCSVKFSGHKCSCNCHFSLSNQENAE